MTAAQLLTETKNTYTRRQVIEFAEAYFQHRISTKEKLPFDLKMLEKFVTGVYQVDYIFVKTRKRRIAEARQCFYYFACRYYGYSKLAAITGYHHATIMHSRKVYKGLIEFDKQTAKKARIVEYLIERNERKSRK